LNNRVAFFFYHYELAGVLSLFMFDWWRYRSPQRFQISSRFQLLLATSDVVWLGDVTIACRTGDRKFASVNKQYNLVLPVKGRWHSLAANVTVGLTSDYPRVTDWVGYPLTGSTAIEREMSTPPMPLVGYDTFTLPYFIWHCVCAVVSVDS